MEMEVFTFWHDSLVSTAHPRADRSTTCPLEKMLVRLKQHRQGTLMANGSRWHDLPPNISNSVSFY